MTNSFFSIKLLPPCLDISIIIPVKNERENVSILAIEINEVMNKLLLSWECVWVDDGSSDGTLEELKKIHAQNLKHRVVSLAENYGQSIALAVGFIKASGNIFVTMDGDGQNDPEDIPNMLNLLNKESLDMVNGIRIKREDSLIRKISSKIANGFRNWITEDKIKDVGCALRVFRRECVENLVVFKGMHRFLPTLVRLNGYNRIAEIPVKHRKRIRGETKYGINNRLWVGLFDTFMVRWLSKRVIFPEIKFELLSENYTKYGKCLSHG